MKKILNTLLLVTPLSTYTMDQEGLRKLHDEVGKNNIEYVSKILAQYPDAAQYQGNDKDTALHVAARESSEGMISLLIDTGNAQVEAQNKTGNAPLTIAAYRGNKEGVAALIVHGAKVNAINVGKYTPLHSAAIQGNACIAQMLLMAGAARNIANNGNETPLDLARKNMQENGEIIELLETFQGPALSDTPQ